MMKLRGVRERRNVNKGATDKVSRSLRPYAVLVPMEEGWWRLCENSDRILGTILCNAVGEPYQLEALRRGSSRGEVAPLSVVCATAEKPVMIPAS